MNNKMGSIQKIATVLEQGTLQGASDGLVRNKIGTIAWIIESQLENGRSKDNIYGAGLIDGDAEFLNSTRAERSGFLAPLFCVW